MVGQIPAAYMFAKTTFELDGRAPGASVADTQRCLAAYEHARERPWTADEREVAWAAGLWVFAATQVALGTHAEAGQSEVWRHEPAAFTLAPPCIAAAAQGDVPPRG